MTAMTLASPRRRLIVVFSLLSAVVVIAGISWASGGASAIGVVTAPDDTYRVEFFDAPRWQGWLHPGMDEPGYVKLYCNKDGRLIATSQVVDFFGGGNAGVLWLMPQTGEVAVGRDIVFTHIPPLDATGHPLPIAHEAGAAPQTSG